MSRVHRITVDCIVTSDLSGETPGPGGIPAVGLQLDAIPEPDDTGSDTFARFRYQAEAAFPACLRCALLGDVLALVPERIEDLLIEEQTRVRFVQIKTRDAGYGPFTYADLLGDGGALRSVLRTHSALTGLSDGRDVVYEIWLERGAKRRNPIEQLLRPHGAGADDDMIDKCAKTLKIDRAIAEDLLGRTIVRAPLPPRELIRDSNIRDLQRFARHVSGELAEQIYDKVITIIEAAMRADLLADEWPTCVMTTEGVEQQLAARIAAKRLDAAALEPLLKPLEGGNSAVLEQITDPEQLAASELDRKLVAAGVNVGTRGMAKQLRANASRAVFEGGTGLEPADRHLDDLDLRVLARATAVAGTVATDPPGPEVYLQAMDDLDKHRDTVDPNRLLSRDPMLIFGRLCELSDRCRFEWRS
jgi:hypothetical protein